jgi:ketosteroid isomerase-like protein
MCREEALMSGSNFALFEAAYSAFVDGGDLEPFQDMLAPDVEWRGWNDEGSCHNRDQVMDTVRSAIARGVRIELPEVIDAGDRLVLIPRDIPPFFPPEAEGLFHVVEIRNGKIVAMRDFIRRGEALAAAGIPSP